MGGGSKQPSTTTQKTEPWSGQQPYLTQIFDHAARLPQTHFFPGQTYAPMSQATQDSLNAMYARGVHGSPEEAAARGWVGNVLGGGQDPDEQRIRDVAEGKYLHGGAGFNAALDAAQRRITPQLSSQFAAGGRYGSGLHAGTQAQALSDSFAGLYDSERGRQQAAQQFLPQFNLQRQGAALGFVPQLSQMDYRNLAARQGVAQAYTDEQQRGIDEQMARWEFEQNEHYKRLAQYAGLVQGNLGSASTTTGANPNQKNPWAGALGGAATGAALGGALLPAAMATGPVGWGIAGLGALAGGLL